MFHSSTVVAQAIYPMSSAYVKRYTATSAAAAVVVVVVVVVVIEFVDL